MISENIYQWNEFYPSIEVFEKDLDSESLYVIEYKKNIIGCISISDYKDIEYENIAWKTEDHNIYIHRLAVLPEFQGMGYAQKMMSYAEDYARKKLYYSVRLDTFSKNLKNQKFYEQRGYIKLGEIYFPKQSKYPFYCYELIC
jgi:ribosomal protein S18 acetylase RimI-like enzyme